MELSVKDLFNEHTCYNFSDKPVSEDLLKEIYDLVKLGPTSANSCPLHIKFITSDAAKEKLLESVMPGNVEHVKSAPVTAIFAYDTKFYEKMDRLFAHNPGIAKWFESAPQIAEESAFRNSTLQAAYFMIVTRSKGLGILPMSGFNAPNLDKSFFADTSFKSNFICSIGYPGPDAARPRLPRLSFDEVCQIV